MFKKIFKSALGEVKTGERKIAIAYPMYISIVFMITITALWRESQSRYMREVVKSDRNEIECESEKNRLRKERDEAKKETAKYVGEKDSAANVALQERANYYREQSELLKLQNETKNLLRKRKN